MSENIRARVVRLVRRYLSLGLYQAGLVNLVATSCAFVIAVVGYFVIQHGLTNELPNSLTVQYARFFVYGPLFFVVVFLDIPWAGTCLSRCISKLLGKADTTEDDSGSFPTGSDDQ